MAGGTQAARRIERREPRERTRQRVLLAAGALFTERGFAKTSVEDIVARAGYTRGAFYSNFRDKDDVFFALMDERLEQRSTQVAEILASGEPALVFEELRDWNRRAADDDPDARVALFAEFRAHALRDPAAREQLAARDQAVRAAYGRAIASQFSAAGVKPPADVDDLALIVQVLDTFVPLQRAVDPDGVREGFLFDALDLLFRASVALSEADVTA
jgi:AcrR family transcriptional regulator